jgi:hypothetical protein
MGQRLTIIKVNRHARLRMSNTDHIKIHNWSLDISVHSNTHAFLYISPSLYGLIFQLPPVSSEKLASFKKYWFIFYMYTTVHGVYRSLRNLEMVMDFQILRFTWTYIIYVQETTTDLLEPKLQNNDEFRWRIHQNMG